MSDKELDSGVIRDLVDRKLSSVYKGIKALELRVSEWIKNLEHKLTDHTRRNIDQLSTTIEEQHKELKQAFREYKNIVVGDGNGNKGLVRRVDALEGTDRETGKRLDMIEKSVNGIPESIAEIKQALRDRAPMSMAPGKTRLGLSPQVQQTLVMAIAAAIAAMLGGGAGQQVMGPTEQAVDTQAEALAVRKAELEKQSAELQQKERELQWRERHQRSLERPRPQMGSPSIQPDAHGGAE